ncbi:toxin-antitoxin system HicB family antitoxin [Clostridium sp. HCS.1]
MEKEKTITIRIDEELHRKIKIKIAKEGITLKDYLVDLIKEDLKINDK